jgi:multidrug efflux pump subunit AcrA (membrane-fusion protein)
VSDSEQQAPDRRGGRRRRLVNIVAFAGLVVFGVAGAAALIATRPELKPAERQEPVFTVETVAVEIGAQNPRLTVFGEVAAGQETVLRALVQGEIVEAAPAFRNGGVVRKGDLLFRIDPFEYEAAVAETKAQIAETRARIAEAEARLNSEKVSLEQDREMWTLRNADAERVVRLHKRGNISDKSRDQALMDLSQQTQTVARREAAIKSEDAKLQQQRAALDRQKVALARAERNLERTQLRAPFDGFLSEVSAHEGALLGVNETVARLVGAGSLEARGHLSDAQYGRLLKDGGLEGRPAQVRWRVGEETLAYDAVVARLTAEIRPETGGVTFYALIDADGLDLPIRPGAFVEISLPDRRFPEAIRLPATAVHDDRRVFVLADGRLAERPVRVLARDGDDVILSGDLAGGDRVVLTRFSEMAPGLKALDPRLSDGAPAADRVAEGQ